MTWIATPANGPHSSKPGTADRADQVSAPVTPLRVLIVEDEFLIALELENRLVDAGFDVVGIAATAGEAIATAGSERPDVAIMDIRLAGGRDGIDTAIELFAKFGIRSIFSSAHASDAETQKRATPASPVGWLQKPYSAHALIRLIKSI
ncbi:response regulator [Phyllobacterium endophyticum]|uniref:response regulator n=1 Tax=Phyllobacterium endophyticum TaxID=1149773 RepID=UPI0011CBD567|nr:response regulator [Phyllobacterium endophyticum]TXR46603.1 response regulator [Phyllobacterium endophyticum]